MSRKIKYLTEYVDSNGVKHTAIHCYDTVTGIVDMMKDYKFDGMHYPLTEVEEEDCRSKFCNKIRF